MIYVDTSALAKLVLQEAESGALREYLRGKNSLASSVLARAELIRTVRRERPDRLGAVHIRLASLYLIALGDEVVDRAGLLEPVQLRTLDAIHLASALLLGRELEALVAYDTRLLGAAAAHGIPTASPR